jgi:hypothetical protein
MVAVAGCAPPTVIGPAEIERAFPAHTEVQLRAALEQDGKLGRFDEIQRRNAAYLRAEAQNNQKRTEPAQPEPYRLDQGRPHPSP